MNRFSLKTAAFFSALVFVILAVTMLLTGSMTMLLYRFGILDVQHREFSLISFAVASIITGTIIAKYAGRRPIAKIVKISEATKQIAKGNFDVRLDEDVPIVEFQEMAHSFNIMIKELASTEMLRNDFIANVSHEFKTPLTAIEGYTMLLQKKGLSEEKRMEYTSRILHSAKRLSTLTGNILLLSKLENQEIGITKESYCLDEQLREVILLFQDQWTEKNLDLEVDLENIDYLGNKELLAQVWQNILGNAMKFAPPSGSVLVRLWMENHTVKVSIADNGDGMDEATKLRVFEKFYQGETSRASAGNGLGLTLAKRIVDLHGGEIDISSEVGKGTTFTVILPITTE